MLIKELSYKLNDYAAFVSMPIQNQSGTYLETIKQVRQGSLCISEMKAYVPNISTELDADLKMIVALGAIFRATDNFGNTHTIGKDELKASLELEKKNEGKAGSKYGYELKITLNSPNGAVFKSFLEE